MITYIGDGVSVKKKKINDWTSFWVGNIQKNQTSIFDAFHSILVCSEYFQFCYETKKNSIGCREKLNSTNIHRIKIIPFLESNNTTDYKKARWSHHLFRIIILLNKFIFSSENFSSHCVIMLFFFFLIFIIEPIHF